MEYYSFMLAENNILRSKFRFNRINILRCLRPIRIRKPGSAGLCRTRSAFGQQKHHEGAAGNPQSTRDPAGWCGLLVCRNLVAVFDDLGQRPGGSAALGSRKDDARLSAECFPRPQARDSRHSGPATSNAEVLDLVQGEPGAQPASKRQAKPLAIKAAGPGGQGMLLLGILPAEAGMRKGLEVSWLPSYGPEMRSGSAHCHVCLSKERIGSSLVSHPDVLIAMNEVSLRKSAPRLLPAASSSINRSRHDVPIERRATSTEENCT